VAPRRNGSLGLSGESGNAGVGATSPFGSGFHSALSQDDGYVLLSPTVAGLSKT